MNIVCEHLDKIRNKRKYKCILVTFAMHPVRCRSIFSYGQTVGDFSTRLHTPVPIFYHFLSFFHKCFHDPARTPCFFPLAKQDRCTSRLNKGTRRGTRFPRRSEVTSDHRRKLTSLSRKGVSTARSIFFLFFFSFLLPRFSPEFIRSVGATELRCK